MTSLSTTKLALDGGTPVRPTPFPPRRLFGEEEKAAVVALFDQSIKSGNAFGYNGPEEDGYCKEFAQMLGGGYADACNSGSTAVYIAIRALNLQPYSEVIVPPITDPGGVMPVPLCNLIPIPADAAPNSYNVDVRTIEARLTPRTSAIMVTHIAGNPVDMDPILELAKSRNIPVIEDCAQSHGATYRGKPCGSFGTVAAFSTMFGKHHATGGQGGVVFTKDQDIYWRIRQAADRGKPFGITTTSSNVTASLNMNMDELHATIGRVQLRKLPGIVSRRRQSMNKLLAAMASLKSVFPYNYTPHAESSHWFTFFRIDTSRLRVDKQQFVKALLAEGLPFEPAYTGPWVEHDWYKNRCVFGGPTGLPWTSPGYKGDPNQSYPLTNLRATMETHFRMSWFECYGDQEVSDIMAGFTRVEDAYLR